MEETQSNRFCRTS